MRQRVEEAALRLSQNRIKCERTLAGATDPSHYGHSAAVDRDIEILEVVLVRSTNLDGGCRWGHVFGLPHCSK